jgi:uncharacterized membrane protein
MVLKDKARVRKIGHLKVAVGFLILAVIGPLMWLTTSLRMEHPSEAIYPLEFFILVITAFVLIAASNRIIDKVYSGKKN